MGPAGDLTMHTDDACYVNNIDLIAQEGWLLFQLGSMGWVNGWMDRGQMIYLYILIPSYFPTISPFCYIVQQQSIPFIEEEFRFTHSHAHRLRGFRV